MYSIQYTLYTIICQTYTLFISDQCAFYRCPPKPCSAEPYAIHCIVYMVYTIHRTCIHIVVVITIAITSLVTSGQSARVNTLPLLIYCVFSGGHLIILNTFLFLYHQRFHKITDCTLY